MVNCAIQNIIIFKLYLNFFYLKFNFRIIFKIYKVLLFMVLVDFLRLNSHNDIDFFIILD
jgi:hypothetical protein